MKYTTDYNYTSREDKMSMFIRSIRVFLMGKKLLILVQIEAICDSICPIHPHIPILVLAPIY